MFCKRREPGIDILIPKAVLDDNYAEKCVDYNEQTAFYDSSLRKELKWYRKVAFELIFGCAIVNSWIVYNQSIATTHFYVFKLTLQLSNLKYVQSVDLDNI